jgi:serine-type D-Ala-D-Ala carboxypeptidase/endopeptidase (penicillin-binding protein 4)
MRAKHRVEPNIRIFIACLCWWVVSAAAAEVTATLPAPVAQAAKSLRVPESAISLWVQRLDAPEPLVAVNPDALRNPASVMKLVTSFAALERLGPAYTWSTEVHLGASMKQGRVAGDVWLRGRGDPYLVAEEYWKLADALRKLGLQHIDGDLVFDTSYFDLPPEDPGAFDNQPNRVYNVIPHPLLVNFNAVRFQVRREGEGVAVSADPPLRNLQMSNRLRLHQAPCGGYQNGVALAVRDAARDQVFLEGQFPTGCGEYSLTRTVLQPESYAFGLFDLYWHQLGGEMSGRWRIGPVPASPNPPFYVHRSRPLGDVIRMVNKYSNNVMTRHLELTLGAEMYGAPANPDKGVLAILEVLGQRGVDTAGLVVSNSAGLSRDSRISARQLATLLRAGWQSPFMPEFMSSLAITGIDGTMRRRLAGTPAAGRMHLKTGTLNDVSAVAGYAVQESGQRWLVVVLVNAPDAHRGPGEQLQDAVLRWVMTLAG